jgi:hypothetical protein
MTKNPNAPENLRVTLSKFKSPLTFNEWVEKYNVSSQHFEQPKLFQGNHGCGIKPLIDLEESGFKGFVRRLFRAL